MEALDLSVRLGPVRTGPFVFDRFAEGSGETVGAVAGSVVSQDSLASNASRRIPRLGTGPESGSGISLFIVEDL